MAGFYIQQDFWEAVKGLPEKSQNAIVGAWVRLWFAGEEPKNLSAANMAVYAMGRERVILSGKRVEAGSKGGSKRQANQQANAKQTSKQNASKHPSKTEANPQANTEANTEAKIENSPSKSGSKHSHSLYIDNITSSNNYNGSLPYSLQALGVFNDFFGTSFTFLPRHVAEFLNTVDEEAYPIEDVKRMLRFKRDEWEGTKFAGNLTPQTLFSPDHFEQYMFQSRKGAESDAYIDELAAQLNW